ncbi:adenosylcobinamide kinase [Paenibacillus antri]|uniref:Adenosylcobinamide kinase n=1 Tax=Paenibacillus antri TaxID=2582848 RepID=A0A5R9G9L5_9BACL|nr:MBL fold metallo-hydrolase [Paenibacillus antri]TLS51056.1 adenosylcobinamide kinase [Paenibacillus antri]
MKLTFLGTGAAEGVPSPFCDCETCAYARSRGGKNVRRRQSALVNDDLLIDMGPDLFASCAALGLSLTKVPYALVTHSHMDHFDPGNLSLRGKAFRLATELPELTMVAGPSVWTKWDAGGSDRAAEIRRVPVLPGRTVELGPYTVRAIEAAHHLKVGDAMNYIVSDGASSLLYASDSGYYADAAWEELEGRALDAVVLEGTIWRHPAGKEHLNEGDFRRMLEKLRSVGAVTERTRIVATHFSHQGAYPHDELEGKVAALGALCAYDGLVVEW